MKDHNWIESVYDSLQGNLIAPVPGVENLFAAGSECERLYAEVLKAYDRLCLRLGKVNDDEDVEVIINALLDIQKRTCMEMYRCGARFGDPDAR